MRLLPSLALVRAKLKFSLYLLAFMVFHVSPHLRRPQKTALRLHFDKGWDLDDVAELSQELEKHRELPANHEKKVVEFARTPS